MNKLLNYFLGNFTSKENTKVNEGYMQPKFEELKNKDAFITFGYSTNESIKDKKDAIAEHVKHF